MSFIDETLPPGYRLQEIGRGVHAACYSGGDDGGCWRSERALVASHARRAAWRHWTAAVLKRLPPMDWVVRGDIRAVRLKESDICVVANAWEIDRSHGRYRIEVAIGAYVEDPDLYRTDDIDEAMAKFAMLAFGARGLA